MEQDKKKMRADIVAGISTAIVMIPQAMAYALLAGLSPIHGLYAATLPVLLYAFLGSSAHISIAPVALLAIMHGVLLHHVPHAIYLEQSLLLTGMVGILMFLFWVLQVGTLARLLSHSIIEGFIQAAALLTSLSQIRYLLGIEELKRGSNLWSMLYPLSQKITLADGTTMAISLACSAILMLRYWKKGPPYALFSVLLGGILVAYGIPTASVEPISQVLPKFMLPTISWERIHDIAAPALIIALVAYVESIALAQHFAAKHRYQISPNRELIALGSANIASSLIGGIAVGAGFSRSAIHEGNGATTNLAGFVSGLCVVLVLGVASSLLKFIPYAALASIVFWASLRLVQPSRIFVLSKHFRQDFILFCAAFAGVLLLGIQEGLGLAILLQILLFPWKRKPISWEEKEEVLHVYGDLNYVEVHRLIAHIEKQHSIRVFCASITNIDAGAMIELEKQQDISWEQWSETVRPKLSPVLLRASIFE